MANSKRTAKSAASKKIAKSPSVKTARKSAAPASSKKSPRSASPAELQKQLDSIDRELLKLLETRCEIAHTLAKEDHSGVVLRMAESALRAQANTAKAAASRDHLTAESKQAFLQHAASLCLGTLHQLRVAYLGPQHSYSHLAAIKYFGDATSFVPVASIQAVFESVSRNDAVAGLVPIENSTDGRVVDTLSMFVRRRMQVCGEVVLRIHHHLLSRTPREEIVEVYSKPQAISQCRGWLANHLPNAKTIDVSSTTAAARIAADKPGAAAIASIEAGREYGLDVIDSNIEDNANNVTRFAILGREQPRPTGDDKTAILFQVNHEPGALADAMVVFKRANLNLTWIESFPIPEKPNEYVFFVELTGHQANPQVNDAIETLSKKTQRLDILGSYPRAQL